MNHTLSPWIDMSEILRGRFINRSQTAQLALKSLLTALQHLLRHQPTATIISNISVSVIIPAMASHHHIVLIHSDSEYSTHSEDSEISTQSEDSESSAHSESDESSEGDWESDRGRRFLRRSNTRRRYRQAPRPSSRPAPRRSLPSSTQRLIEYIVDLGALLEDKSCQNDEHPPANSTELDLETRNKMSAAEQHPRFQDVQVGGPVSRRRAPDTETFQVLRLQFKTMVDSWSDDDNRYTRHGQSVAVGALLSDLAFARLDGRYLKNRAARRRR